MEFSKGIRQTLSPSNDSQEPGNSGVAPSTCKLIIRLGRSGASKETLQVSGIQSRC